MDATWRTRLWTVPADTLLGVPEIAEALGRSVSWTHKRTAPSSDDPLPVRKLGASVVVTAGDLREWIQDHLEAA
jgi:predicted DNA-binding transcriptional regulator AlpA